MFEGKYIRGEGPDGLLSLIDESFSMLHPCPTLPSLNMLYNPSADTFREGFIWGNGWWIQNSFGFFLGAVPLLRGHWREVLQNSLSLFWDRIGDGERIGSDDGLPRSLKCFNLRAPDGALGDAVIDGGIVYKQGDGPFDLYDWFYEATAAGVLMQAELFLAERRREPILALLPKIKRALAHIESTRDSTGRLLTGPACNLLAPSHGGDRLEKNYLAGLHVTYTAALSRVRELALLVGDGGLERFCADKILQNLAVLPQFFTKGGFLCKSIDADGTMHGVPGAEKYGYFESVCNVDAAAHGVVSGRAAEKILSAVAESGARPYGALCNNFPHLDDTPQSYLKNTSAPDSLGFPSGDWVDGGCWATVEGRAILASLKYGRFDEAFAAAEYYMQWAREYRQDAPLSQWGANVCNSWQDERGGIEKSTRPVSVMIDNFAPVTCLLRGLFGFEADARGLTLTPRIPESISLLEEKEPFFFGGKYYALTFDRRAESVLSDGRVTLGTAPLRIPCGLSDAAQPDDSFENDRLAAAKAARLRKVIPFTGMKFRPMTPLKREKIFGLYDSAAEML